MKTDKLLIEVDGKTRQLTGGSWQQMKDSVKAIGGKFSRDFEPIWRVTGKMAAELEKQGFKVIDPLDHFWG